MQDKVIEAVIEDFKKRSEIGIKKYNTTLDRKDLSLKDWLQHAYEECLDQANYLKKAIIEYNLIEESHNQEIRGIRDQYESSGPDERWNSFKY